MMKRTRSLISIAMATIVLLSLCAVYAGANVSPPIVAAAEQASKRTPIPSLTAQDLQRAF
jgi:uncharacterized lipoprotein YajG